MGLYIREDQDDIDFDIIADVFDDNLFIISFAIKNFCMKHERPSYILEYVENRNYSMLKNSVCTLLDMPHKELMRFKDIFKTVSKLETYESYKGIYELYVRKEKEIEDVRKKHEKNLASKNKIIVDLNEKVKYYERDRKNRSLF